EESFRSDNLVICKMVCCGSVLPVRPPAYKSAIYRISLNGVLIIDKPAGMTSHDVVNRVRRILHQPSVGHLGTLDPLATGVLPLVTGNLTRLAQFYGGAEKTYEGVIRFGFATDTYDSDGEPQWSVQTVHVSL